MRWSSRPLRALQVEVTSRCTRRCVVCPRSALADEWSEGDFAERSWERLLPDLELVDHVHLQGWGEPLLHSHLPFMARDARSAGCTVGITTNGDLLSRAASWVSEGAVDLITLSVAGDREGHRRLRDGSDLSAALESVASVAGQRGRRRRPRIQIGYLLTVDNAAELASVVEQAALSHADEVFVVHLDCACSREIEDLAAFGGDGLRSGVREGLLEGERVARKCRIAFRGPESRPRSLLTCALNPLRFAFVGWDGAVHPCVNLGLPVRGTIPRWSGGRGQDLPAVSYGSLEIQPLRDILAGDPFRRFTSVFAERLASEKTFHASLDCATGTTALDQLDRADRDRNRALAESPFPEACAGCPKRVGW